MLSIGRIGSGQGFRYLTNQVATQDAPHPGERLLSYYERSGYPPGTWVGEQAMDFGLSGTVDEESMQALFGGCADPRDGSQLGRRMAIYRTVEERVVERIGGLDHPVTDQERASITAEEQHKGTPQAVTGFDLTFSAPKSVSVLFAVGDAETRELVRGAHEAAWHDAYAYFEKEVVATRLGAGGVAQVDVKGVTGAAFEHWYSRAGDPQLHTHVATSVMVQTTDGRYRRLDSRALYRASAAAGERYTATLMAELAKDASVSWRHRSSGRSGKALPEIAGVSDELIRTFSQRGGAINDSLARLAGEYRDKHGYAPSREALARLAQQATLSDRPGGEQRSLIESTQDWTVQAAGVLECHSDEVAGRLAGEISRSHPGGALKVLRRGKSHHQAHKTLERLVEGGATWSEWDLRRATTAQLREAGYRADARAVERVMTTALALPEMVAIAPPEPDETPESLRRADGSSIFARRGEARYTSQLVLDAESGLVALAGVRHLPRSEVSRRATTLFPGIEDDAMVMALDGARRHIADLGRRLSDQHQAASDAQDDLSQADSGLAHHGDDAGPRLALLRRRLGAETQAAQRLVVIDDALGRRGLRRAGKAERDALLGERSQLVGLHPHAGEPAGARQIRAENLTADASRADQVERDQLLARRRDARHRLAKAGGVVKVLGAEISEQTQGTRAIEAELRARQRQPRRVDLTGRLEGLGADQAAAMVRLADPSRPLDALIGPAGSGKTTALARLVKGFSEQGHAVQILAPTAVGAQELGEAVDGPHSTLHSAVGAWRKGRRLPGEGDLVLIDEASMATTTLLLDAARIATSRGALVRLIGDPRQLKAVGAGGGLSLVANAVGAPELGELRRFNHQWEAQATLGLRRGDPSALDAYLSHNRVVGALDSVAIDDVFRAWWDSPAGRAATIMVASDNATVRQLNLLARQARLDAGEINPSSSLELHDATTVGAGDLVTTRKNDMASPTRPNAGKGAYVRNHDRWLVVEAGEDGTLLVEHLKRGERVRLAAPYVAQHVELAYADTGHAVQGRTVERAEVLVRPSDTRWYLYVAMSRAKEHNTAHVVTDQLEEEPAGYHPTPSPRDVLEVVLSRDEPVSAMDWLQATEAARTDPALIAEQYRTGGVEELRARLGRALAAHGGGDVLGGVEGWRVMAAAEAVEVGGLDAGAIVVEVGVSDSGAINVQGLVTALQRAQFSGWDPTGRARSVPLAAGVLPGPGDQVAPDVAAWQTSLAGRLKTWRDDLAARLTAGEQPPQWAAPMGQPPAQADLRAEWATQVAQVGLYRASHRVEGEDHLLGPDVAIGSPGAIARARAGRAVAAAQELAGRGKAPDRRTQPAAAVAAAAAPPQPDHQYRRGGPRL